MWRRHGHGMRQILLRAALAAALTASFVTAPAVQAQTRKAPAARRLQEPKPPQYEPQERMKTSEEIKQESLGGAATTPLRDLGVEKTDIPEILLQALNDPYAKPPRGYGCAYLVALVKPLDDALGPDIDLTPVSGDENLVNRRKVLGVAADVASSALIPFRGVVRKISGAEAHDRLAQSAYVAGSVRRAYLKGLGEARGCMPPATPSHERAGSAPIAEEKHDSLRPKYPTRAPDGPQTRGGTPPNAPR